MQRFGWMLLVGIVLVWPICVMAQPRVGKASVLKPKAYRVYLDGEKVTEGRLPEKYFAAGWRAWAEGSYVFEFDLPPAYTRLDPDSLVVKVRSLGEEHVMPVPIHKDGLTWQIPLDARVMWPQSCLIEVKDTKKRTRFLIDFSLQSLGSLAVVLRWEQAREEPLRTP